MTKVKLCGLMRPQDAEAVSAAGADFAGMILSPGFRRTVTRETAAAIRRALSPAIPAAGVFVNAEIAEIAAYAESGIIQLVQLHGDESAEYLKSLRKICSLPIIKAFRMRSPADTEAANRSEADLVLLDAGTGTGQAFDRSLLRGIARPYILAGGLTPENVASAVAAYHPFGVDVSSGTETDGQKDPAKIAAFVRAVRGY